MSEEENLELPQPVNTSPQDRLSRAIFLSKFLPDYIDSEMERKILGVERLPESPTDPKVKSPWDKKWKEQKCAKIYQPISIPQTLSIPFVPRFTMNTEIVENELLSSFQRDYEEHLFPESVEQYYSNMELIDFQWNWIDTLPRVGDKIYQQTTDTIWKKGHFAKKLVCEMESSLTASRFPLYDYKIEEKTVAKTNAGAIQYLIISDMIPRYMFNLKMLHFEGLSDSFYSTGSEDLLNKQPFPHKLDLDCLSIDDQYEARQINHIIQNCIRIKEFWTNATFLIEMLEMASCFSTIEVLGVSCLTKECVEKARTSSNLQDFSKLKMIVIHKASQSIHGQLGELISIICASSPFFSSLTVDHTVCLADTKSHPIFDNIRNFKFHGKYLLSTCLSVLNKLSHPVDLQLEVFYKNEEEMEAAIEKANFGQYKCVRNIDRKLIK